jgi:hypothetical protein
VLNVNRAHLSKLWNKLVDQKQVIICVMGGSVAAGNQLEDNLGNTSRLGDDRRRGMLAWPSQLELWLNTRFPLENNRQHRVINLAVGGTTSSWHATHLGLPLNTIPVGSPGLELDFIDIFGSIEMPTRRAVMEISDLVVAEFGVNDDLRDKTTATLLGVERFMRLVLQPDSRRPSPAVIFFEFEYYFVHPSDGATQSSRSPRRRFKAHFKVAKYYHQTFFDFRGALLDCPQLATPLHSVQQLHLSLVNTYRQEPSCCNFETLWPKSRAHPTVQGHRTIAEGLVLFIAGALQVPAAALKLGGHADHHILSNIKETSEMLPTAILDANRNIGSAQVHLFTFDFTTGRPLLLAEGGCPTGVNCKHEAEVLPSTDPGWKILADDYAKRKRGFLTTTPRSKLQVRMLVRNPLSQFQHTQHMCNSNSCQNSHGSHHLVLVIGFLFSYTNVGRGQVTVQMLRSKDAVQGVDSVETVVIDTHWESTSSQYHSVPVYLADLSKIRQFEHLQDDQSGADSCFGLVVSLELLPSDHMPYRGANKLKVFDMQLLLE